MKKIVRIATMASICLPQLLHSQTPDTTQEVSELEPIIIRSIRAKNVSPFAQSTLQKADIEKDNQGLDLSYLMQHQTGLVATSDAGIGIGYTNMSIRGTDGTRINVTINGIPINNPESQGSFLVNIPDLASSTQSVQIQRGVGSSTNGGGAFGGTVSINNMVNSEQANGSLQASIGSFNTQKLTLQASTGRLKNGWAFDTRLSQITSDGYVDRSNSNLRSLQFLSSWNINKKSKLTINYMLGHEKTGQAWNGLSADELAQNRRQNTLGKMSNGNFYPNQTDNYQQHHLHGFYDWKINPYLQTQIGAFWTKGAGYYEEFRGQDSYEDYNLNPPLNANGDTLFKTDLIRQLWLDNDFYGGVYNILYEKNKLHLTFGGMISNYRGDHFGEIMWAQNGGIAPLYRWYDLPANKLEVNNYIKAQYQFNPKLWLFADLQYRFVNYEMNGFRKNPDLYTNATYNFINPKFGLNYYLKNEKNNEQYLYASYAMANKEPNRDDFEANTQEQPKPEQLQDIELGYKIQRKNWQLEVNAYYMHYNNQLVLNGRINDVGASTRINVDKSFRRGIEITGAWQPKPFLDISGNLTRSQNKIVAFDEFIDNWDTWEQSIQQHSNTDIALSPNTIAALGIGWKPLVHTYMKDKWTNLQLRVQWKYVGKQYLDNSQRIESQLAAYHFTNIHLNYELPLGKKRSIIMGASVQNAFNQLFEGKGYTYTYTETNTLRHMNFYFPQAGAHLLINVGLKF